MRKRKLQDRIEEHEKAIKNPKLSNVAEHVIKTNHQVDFSNPKIIYKDNNFKSRMFLESWNIEQCKINKQNIINDKQNAKTCIQRQYLTIMKRN